MWLVIIVYQKEEWIFFVNLVWTFFSVVYQPLWLIDFLTNSKTIYLQFCQDMICLLFLLMDLIVNLLPLFLIFFFNSSFLMFQTLAGETWFRLISVDYLVMEFSAMKGVLGKDLISHRLKLIMFGTMILTKAFTLEGPWPSKGDQDKEKLNESGFWINKIKEQLFQ